MLTDDGKHLYVTWDEYHMLIERLALKVHESGWQFDQILCLARGGMRPGDVLSRIFDKPLAIMSTSSYRAEAGTIQGQLDMAKYITLPQGELAGRVLLVDDLVDSGDHAARGRRPAARACPPISELRSAVDLDQGRLDLHARLLRRAAADQPVDPPAVRGVRRPAAGRAGASKFADLKADADEQAPARKARPAFRSHVFTWCPGRDSNPHGVTPLGPEPSASTNSATWAGGAILKQAMNVKARVRRTAYAAAQSSRAATIHTRAHPRRAERAACRSPRRARAR